MSLTVRWIELGGLKEKGEGGQRGDKAKLSSKNIANKWWWWWLWLWLLLRAGATVEAACLRSFRPFTNLEPSTVCQASLPRLST